MAIRIGGNWTVWHLTDRVVELRNDDYLYHRLTGRPGFVRVRVDPEMTRADAVERAIILAKQNDELLSERAVRVLVPTAQALADYSGQQVRFKNVFSTPEDEDVIGRQRP